MAKLFHLPFHKVTGSFPEWRGFAGNSKFMRAIQADDPAAGEGCDFVSALSDPVGSDNKQPPGQDRGQCLAVTEILNPLAT